MIVNQTNYRAIARYLAKNWSYVEKASSYNQLTSLINSKIREEKIANVNPQLKLQIATVSTIVYALQGAIDVLQD